jgi:hypothetical protein
MWMAIWVLEDWIPALNRKKGPGVMGYGARMGRLYNMDGMLRQRSVSWICYELTEMPSYEYCTGLERRWWYFDDA